MNEQKTERPEAAEAVKDTRRRNDELLKKLDIMLHLYNDGYKLGDIQNCVWRADQDWRRGPE